MLVLKFLVQSYFLSMAVKSMMYKFVSMEMSFKDLIWFLHIFWFWSGNMNWGSFELNFNIQNFFILAWSTKSSSGCEDKKLNF